MILVKCTYKQRSIVCSHVVSFIFNRIKLSWDEEAFVGSEDKEERDHTKNDNESDQQAPFLRTRAEFH